MMSAATAPQTWSNSAPRRDLGWRAALPVAVLLMVQVGLYVWMAPRGFEFTDEAYYLLNYLHWRDLVAMVSFFGAYFELPFRMLGQSVPAIRIFSLFLLLASSAFLTREALRFSARQDGPGNDTPLMFVAVGMAASLFYFGYLSTVRAPSYNLLAVCSMLVATGLLLRLLVPSTALTSARMAMFCYGVTLGVCGLSKSSSGVILVVFHALFFALANNNWRLRHVIELVALPLAGVSLNFAVLQWVHPQWLAVLRGGVALFSYSNEDKLLQMANAFRWDIQKLAPMLPWVIGGAVAFVFLVRWIGPSRRNVLSAMVITLVAGCVVGLMWDGLTRLWLPMLGLTVFLLWSVEVFCRKPVRLTRADRVDFGLMCLLLALPVAASFGTSMPVLEHSQQAAVFAVIALCLRLNRLSRLGLLATSATIVCLTALCVPTLVIQLKAALDVHYTYRQLSALGKQTMPVHLGEADNTLLVDAATHETLQSVIGSARAVGLVPGQVILDFTGDGPGLVFALGGRPLGLAWLLGGYPNSEGWAERLLARLAPQELRSAWLLTSDDNSRGIRGWPQLLNARVGADTHELAATVLVHMPYRWDANSPVDITVQIWKPRGSVGGQRQ